MVDSKSVGGLEEYRVDIEVPFVYYIKNFLSDIEESDLITEIYKAPKPKWTNLKNRRLQNWGGIPQPDGKPMLVEPLPQFLKNTNSKIETILKVSDIKFNHVLINEYLSGQGITEHEDGPTYLPLVATVNLGSTVVIRYRPKPEVEFKSHFQLLLEPKSLVLMGERIYTDYLHSIEEISFDKFLTSDIHNFKLTGIFSSANQEDSKIELNRSTRISLTFRKVKNCSVLNSKSPLSKYIKS